MRAPVLILFVALCASAHAQTPLPPKSDAPVMRPDEPGIKTPGSGAMVVVPPTTGNEEIAKKPKNVDPKMDDATGDIDRKNREQSENKGKSDGKSDGKRKGSE